MTSAISRAGGGRDAATTPEALAADSLGDDSLGSDPFRADAFGSDPSAGDAFDLAAPGPDLFGDADAQLPWDEPIAPGAMLLRHFACADAPALLQAARAVAAAAPFRHWLTPGGRRMSVAMTNCGALGWISEPRGYRYGAHDPASGLPWPALPPIFVTLAAAAAARAGYPAFAPQACLLNLYRPGARLSLHQDKDELDLDAPIVSVSLGLPARFLFGGTLRGDRVRRFALAHGDVAVWGGAARLAFHGVAPLAPGRHPATGAVRLNLTFRKVR